eukprot:scaffold6397_cov175-Ochromonas_danica.AAC.4
MVLRGGDVLSSQHYPKYCLCCCSGGTAQCCGEKVCIKFAISSFAVSRTPQTRNLSSSLSV